MMKKILITIYFCQAITAFCSAQTKPNEQESRVYILDTISIDSPVLVLLNNSMGQYNWIEYILLAKSDLTTLLSKPNISFQNFWVSEKGYRLFFLSDARCLMPHMSEKEQNSLYKLLEKDLSVSSNQPEVVFKNGRPLEMECLGWKYYEVICKKFFFCLVRGDLLKTCESEDFYLKGANNVYFKVLLPRSQ